MKQRVGSFSKGMVNTMEKKINVTKNETRDAVIAFLQANPESTFTLKEIGDAIGKKLTSGTVNALIAAGVLTNGEDKMVEVVKKEPRKTYAIGDLTKYNDAK